MLLGLSFSEPIEWADSFQLGQVTSQAKAELPEPFNRVLDHRGSMTRLLEDVSGTTIHLHVLETNNLESGLRRTICLEDDYGHRYLFGIIQIDLKQVGKDLADQICKGYQPLGSLLSNSGITFRGEPQGFFRLPAPKHVAQAMGIEPDTTCYGRVNRIVLPDGSLLAQVVEILTPNLS